MTTALMTHKGKHQLTFEDLRGLRAEGYVRDSTLDQKDGYGPALQVKANEGFAHTYGLVLGNSWYTDFITGTSTLKRSGFHQALADAQLDRFDVLLVYHTSRFARNRADAIRYKAEFRKLGKVVVFVSQGIISGNNNDFMNEGIHELMDEQYSRNVSGWVSDGLRMKHDLGVANGVPPLGYKSEKPDGGRERKVSDPATMPTLLELLSCYSGGHHSFQGLADYLNAHGYRTREGKMFTKGSVEHILSNRFYAGKAVYHPGEPDEEAMEGKQDVPQEVKNLWQACQEVKRHRARRQGGKPRLPHRAYPFTRLTVCDQCGRPYAGRPYYQRSGKVVRRLCHGHSVCELKPHCVDVERLSARFCEGVLPYISLDKGWKEAVAVAMRQREETPERTENLDKVKRALDNLKKQHLWGDVSDEEYAKGKRELSRQYSALPAPSKQVHIPDLERAAQILTDLPALWSHPGVTEEQRETLISEVFQQVRVRGKEMVAVEPKPEYQPLFAYALTNRIDKESGRVGSAIPFFHWEAVRYANSGL